MACTEEDLRQLQWLLDRKATELHLIYNVSTIIAGALREPTMFEELWPFLEKAMSLSAMSVTMAEPGGGLYLAHSSGTAVFRMQVPMEGVPGTVIASARPLFIKDCSSYEGFLHYPGEKRQDGTSLISVPLKQEDRVIGVLSLEKGGDRFESDDVDMVVMVGLLAAIGLQKCGLFEKTERLSLKDGLTGLFNHRVFMEKLCEELKRMDRTKRPVTLVMMDIDNFKLVNDRFGHKEGDRLLSEVARAMSSQVRIAPTDVLTRYGGEEFALLLAETPLDQAVVVAERMRKAVAKYPFSLAQSQPGFTLTISGGVASAYVNDSSEVDLVAEADKALYHSKRNGKNRTSYIENGSIILMNDE